MKFCLSIIILVLTISTATTSCGTAKKIPAVVAKQDSLKSIVHKDSIELRNQIYNNIKKNNIDYTTFSAKVKLDFRSEAQNYSDLTAFIRMKKDSIIWVNVEFILVPVARIVITKDSFILINRTNSSAQIRGFSFLQDAAKIPFDFATLQDVIIGNPVYFGKKIVSIKQNENTTTLLSIEEIFKNLLTIDNTSHLIQHCKLDDIDEVRSRTCDLSFNDYETKDNMNFSKSRDIILTEKSKIEINLTFKQFKFNQELTYPINIPNSYKRL